MFITNEYTHDLHFLVKCKIMGAVTWEIELFSTDHEAKIVTYIQLITKSFISPRQGNTNYNKFRRHRKENFVVRLFGEVIFFWPGVIHYGDVMKNPL